MKLRHPNRDTLQQWLNGDGDSATDLHVGTCQRCASKLEELEPDSESDIGQALAAALAPPEDLTDRLEEGVNARLSSRQVMNVVADLFGAGLETSRLLLIEEENDND